MLTCTSYCLSPIPFCDVISNYYAQYDDYYDELIHGDIRAEGSISPDTDIPRDFNRIPNLGNGVYKKNPETGLTRPGDQRFQDQFAFPEFPYDFPSGFESFPFNLDQDDINIHSSLINSKTSSARPSQPPPLGAPGFTFPKLPSLKNPTSVVDATAFAKLGNITTNPSDDFANPLKDNFDFNKAVEIPNRPLSNQYPLKPATTSSTAQTSKSVTPKFTPPPQVSTLSQSTTPSIAKNPTSMYSTRVVSTSHRTPSKPQITLKDITTKAPFHMLTQSIRRSSQMQTTPTLPSQSLDSTPFQLTSGTTASPFPSRQSITLIHQIPTRQPVPPRQTEINEQTHFKDTHATKSPLREDSRPLIKEPPFREDPMPKVQEPDVITAPSLPRLPGQLSSAPEKSPPFRLPSRYTSQPPKSSVPPEFEDFADTFAQNFGFDPHSVVYESDFRPVRKNKPGPTLAFEVSSSDVIPKRVPLPPRPPRWSSQRRPAGPRTSGPIGFSHRIIKVDNDHETTNDFAGSPNVGVLPTDTLGPVFHPSVTLNKKLKDSPIPLPVPMSHLVPLLGGGASNQPLKPNQSHQLHHRKINTHTQTGPVRSSASVDRMGIPQGPLVKQAARRRVTALVSLPDDLAVPVPQFVGPQVLKPVFNFPVENELTAAASAQVFASDGRPLSPDTVPAPPPQLSTRPRRPTHLITNRPQVGPFRGSLPPPVPAQVPPLTQFIRQRRPVSRHTTPSPPPLQDEFINPGRLTGSGSNVRPVILSHQEAPGIAAALLPYQQLSVDIGTNEVISASPPLTTAEAYAPTRPPTTQRSDKSVAGVDSNRTHINILKDVWAILTMEDPDLKPEHPRDDAHPNHDHDHLDRQERRRRRDASLVNSANILSTSPVTLLAVLIVLSLGR